MKSTMKLAVASAAAVLLTGTAAYAQETVEAVKARGELVCGVSAGLGGFSVPGPAGKWSGLVDYCGGGAAAILGDASNVKFQALTAQQRFTAWQSGEVDMLSRNTAWTPTIDKALDLNFTGVTYYEGQGFMGPKKLGVKSAKVRIGSNTAKSGSQPLSGIEHSSPQIRAIHTTNPKLRFQATVGGNEALEFLVLNNGHFVNRTLRDCSNSDSKGLVCRGIIDLDVGGNTMIFVFRAVSKVVSLKFELITGDGVRRPIVNGPLRLNEKLELAFATALYTPQQ